MFSACVLARQAHDHVIGSHHGSTAVRGLAGKLPEILPIIKYLGSFHVVGPVCVRLDEEEILRVAHMPLQVLAA